MRNKIIAAIAVGAVCFSVSNVTTFAATVDEVAEAARAYGLSEEDIQVGYNEYYAHPEKYPPEKLDEVIVKLRESGNTIVSTVPYNPDYTPVTSTVSAEPVTEAHNETDSTTIVTSEPAVANLITLTDANGTEFTRVSAEDFINMSYEQKMAYLGSFPQDRQQIIINHLSPAEYKSLIKQSPADKKMEIIHSLSGAADEMGLSLTVDEVSDSSLTISMRNDEGTLVNVSSAGASVEDTGYDRRGLFASAAAAVIAAIAGLVFLTRRCFNKK